MNIYVVVYGIIILSVVFDTNHFSKRFRNIVLAIDVLLITCFVGLRWNVGSDWEQYLTCFRTIKDSEMFHYYRYGTQYFEPLYSFVNWITKFIVGINGYSIFLFWTSALRFILYAWTCKKITDYPILSFVALLSVDLGFPTARTGLAFAFVIASFVFVLRQNVRKYLLLIILAFLIHKMCIIFLPLYWLFNKIKINYLTALGIYTFSVVFSAVADKYLPGLGLFFSTFASDDDLQEKITTYTSWQTNEGVAKSIFSLALVYLWISLFFYQKKYLSKIDEYKQNALLWAYILCVSLTSAFSVYFTDLTRLAVAINTWPFLLTFTIKAFTKYKMLILFFIICFMFYRLSQFFDGIYYKDYYEHYNWVFGL